MRSEIACFAPSLLVERLAERTGVDCFFFYLNIYDQLDALRIRFRAVTRWQAVCRRG